MSGFFVSVCFYFCVYFLLTETKVATSASKIEIVIEPNVTELEVEAGNEFNLTCKGNVPLAWTNSNRENASTVTALHKNGRHISIFKLYQPYFLDTGFFYCFPLNDSLNSSHAAKIYIYVKDRYNLLAVSEEFNVMPCKQYKTILLPCRPTARDVVVKLTINDIVVTPNGSASDMDVTYDSKKGYSFYCSSSSIAGEYTCTGSRGDTKHSVNYLIRIIQHTDSVCKPNIKIDPPQIIVGDKVTMDCACSFHEGVKPFLNWTVPTPKLIKSGHIKIMTDREEKDKINPVPSSMRITHKELVIYNATKEDQGTYSCRAKDPSHNTNEGFKILKIYDKHVNFLNLSVYENKSVFEESAGAQNVHWTVNIETHPPLNNNNRQVIWFDPRKKEIIDNNKKYTITTDKESSKLKIIRPDISDAGTYTLVVNNTVYNRTINITLFVKDRPRVVSIVGKSQGFYMVNEIHIVECNVIAYPEPNIKWYFKDCSQNSTCSVNYISIPSSYYSKQILDQISLKSVANLPSDRTGELLCNACNNLGCANYTAPFVVTDVENGFSASAPKHYVVTSDNITLHCGASKYNYSSDVNWYYRQGNATPSLMSNSSDMRVTYFMKLYSHNVMLNIPKVKLHHWGEYICKARNLFRNTSEEHRLIVDVRKLQAPVFLKGSNLSMTLDKLTGQNIKWNCFVNGTPSPMIVWRKNNEVVKNDEKYILSSGNQTLEIKFLAYHDDGVYTCTARNKAGFIIATGSVILTDKPGNLMKYMIGVVIICLILLVVMTGLYVRKLLISKELERELTAAGLLHFEQGCIESLNPELDVFDQAEFLPYDKRWEFPREKLKLGKQLGSGAFGVVLKAEAHGLIEPDVSTVVAVKMVKSNYDITFIKALASELKIMIHLGKHLNVVNVLGACTGNLKKRELFVIVEFCRYGNLHNYLLQHREVFINQVNTNTGKFDPMYISSSPRLKSGFSFSNHVQANAINSGQSQTDETHVASDMSTSLGEDGYLMSKEPEDWSYYRGDYKKTSVQSVCTQDLLSWGFQVACGMEYLAKRKVMHGDLAARNILLADDNVVKICDFGFSKNMYKDNSYHKKGKGPLPVKWMSIEAIQDRVFSTQSDVWSYGILLWELFSLCQTPYPGMEADEVLFNKLIAGYRMEQPKYATNDVYKVMLECWHSKPQMRPSFTVLAEQLGNMLEDTVRMHYVDMNDPFLKSNTEFLAQQDYLSMLRSPTYSNWQASPFDGYTSMKPGRIDAEYPTEITPMLDSATCSSGATCSSYIESPPNSPVYKPSTPTGNNYVNVAQALSFSNASYHNLDRPKKSPYINMAHSAGERQVKDAPFKKGLETML